MKKLWISIFTLALVCTTFFSMPSEKGYARCGTDGYRTYDNDHGKLNSSYNKYTGTWTHKYYGASYNGDHRYNTTSSDYRYYWNNGTCDDTQYWYVYLNSYEHTNSAAKYYSESTALGQRKFIKSLNQEYAPGGWNYLGTGGTTYDINANWFYVTAVDALSGEKTGADAMRVY